MSHNLFAHEEDDENYYGFRKDPKQEAAEKYQQQVKTAKAAFELYTWPAIVKKMQAGKALGYYDAYDVRIYGTYKQLQEVEGYKKSFSAAKNLSLSNTVKPGLEISQPGDASEVQADAVADAVVSGGDAAALMEASTTTSTASPQTQPGSPQTTTPKFDAQLQASKGSGQQLDESTRSNMEAQMGTDLSGVKIHTDSNAQEMADAVNAKAFTHGQDVYFGSGFSPGDTGLLAHELAHVGLGGNSIYRMPGDQWKTINEAELFQLKNNTLAVVCKIPPETKTVELYYEYSDQTNAYHYVYVKTPDQKTVTGFIRKEDLELMPVEPVIFDPEKDKVMREGIRYNYQLTKEQSDYFNWPAVIAVFRALPAHSRVGQYYLEQWARKQLKAGWRLTDPVPDLTAYRAEFGEPKVYEVTKEIVPTLYVYWYAENRSKIRHELLDKNKHNYKGFWVFVDSITGYESELQQNDSFAKFYQVNPVSTIEMTNLFLFIADRKIIVEHTQADIQQLGVDSEELRIILEKVQNVLYKGVRVSGYGMYTWQTRKDINKAVELIKQKEQEELQREIAAYNQQPLADITIADQELVAFMSTTECTTLYQLRTDIGVMLSQYVSYKEDPTHKDRIDKKREEYNAALANSPFKTAEGFENKINELQNVFQNRAFTVANNILNNTQNLITQERNSYSSKPSRLTDMAVLLYEAKVEYEDYLAYKWEGDKMNHIMEQNESYPYKGMLNDNDAMAISSLQRSMDHVAVVRDAGHPLLDYFIQPGRADELGKLLGYSYQIGYNYQNARNDSNYKNPYRTRFAVSMGMAKKVEVVDTAHLFSTISSAVDTMSGNINTTRQNLKESPKKVWDLDNVVAFTFDDMGMKEGTVAYKMVKEELNRRQSIKFFKEIFLAACNIGLAILACSGIGTPFAILAGLGAAAISTYQYFDHKADYEFRKAASGTGTSSGTSLLSSEPDATWLLLDLVGIGIDVFAALKIIAAVGKTAKLFRLANATEDAAVKARLLDELDNALRTNVAKQADELMDALRRQLDDADHVKDIRTKDYSVNEIKTKADAADAPRVYEKAELKRIVANAEQIGDVKVWRGKEAEQFLNHNGANAMYLPGEVGQPGALVLRESASRNVIIEELLHLEQHRILGFRELSTADILRLENEAQEALLKYAKASNWTDDEIKLIEENQQYWKREKAKVDTDANYAVEFESRMKGLKNIDQRDYDRISRAAYYFTEEGKTAFDDFLAELKAGKRIKGGDKMDLADPDIEKAFKDGQMQYTNKASILRVNPYSGKVVEKYIKPSDLNTNVGSKHPWTGANDAPQWANPYSTKAYGHIPSEHGPKLKPDHFKGRIASTKNNQGQFYDEMIWVEAEKIIDSQPGYYLIRFDNPIGRVYMVDGNIINDVHQVLLRRNKYGMIKFGFPVLDTQSFDELFKIHNLND